VALALPPASKPTPITKLAAGLHSHSTAAATFRSGQEREGVLIGSETEMRLAEAPVRWNSFEWAVTGLLAVCAALLVLGVALI
jgi:hypothetical protein